MLFPSAQSGSEVPGWGIALLVLVCVLVLLAIIYLIALVSAQPLALTGVLLTEGTPRPLITSSPQAVCQCYRKKCGQLDIFPTRDAYHPMSEYPTYHTHERYVPPGSTRRRPYEEVRLGPGLTGRGRWKLWLGRGSERVLGKPK